MRVFISSDIEGVAGVAGGEQTTSSGFEFSTACKWMTQEVVAAADAAHHAGAKEVIIADGHGSAQNILLDELPDYVRLVRSWPRPLLQMQGIEEGTYDAAVFIGHHTAIFSTNGLRSHTYHGGCYRDIRLNGESQSETSLNCLLAAHYHVPVVFSAGDSDYIEYVRELSPDIETVITKKAYGYGAINTLTSKKACSLIREGVARALARLSEIKLQKLPDKYEIELDFQSRPQAEMFDYLPWISRTGAFTIAAKFSSMVEVMKFITFGMLYQATGVPGFK